MSEVPGLVVTGASGRMGQMLVKMISASSKVRLVGCVEREGNDWVGGKSRRLEVVWVPVVVLAMA